MSGLSNVLPLTNASSKELESGSAPNALLHTPAPVLDKIP